MTPGVPRSIAGVAILSRGLARSPWPWPPATARSGIAGRAGRSQRAAGMRGSEQPALLQRPGRGVRERDRRAAGRAARRAGALYLASADRVGFVRNTLRAQLCDLVMGVGSANELLQNTNPYYRSTYVLAHRAADGDRFADLASPTMRDGADRRDRRHAAGRPPGRAGPSRPGRGPITSWSTPASTRRAAT